jgi:acyl-coenzyme A synthetase/AMP-(fatty) acid ligase
MQSYPDIGDIHAPCPSDFNMAEYVLAHADITPEKVALSVLSNSGARRISYVQLKSDVLCVAQGLLDAGVEPDDRVLMRLGNTVDFPITYLAAIAIGAVPVPTSSVLTETEVAKIITDINPTVIVHDGACALPDTVHRVLNVEQIEAFKSNSCAEFHRGDPNRLAYVVYTSGTSGHPRAVMHAHRAIWARRMMIRDWYCLNAEDRLLHAGAFNWTFTLGTGLMDPWSVGATALIPEPNVDLKLLPLLLSRHDATLFAAAPGVIRKLNASLPDQFRIPKLRHVLSAGEKLSPEVRSTWRMKTGVDMYEAFGMSECSTFLSSAPHRPSADHALGWPQRGRRISLRAVHDPTQEAMLGEEGIIAVHQDDPGLMLGYFNAAGETADRFVDGWFLTGDHARIGENGAYYYTGRKDDMMNAGGFRVSPIELEYCLSQVQGITSMACVEVEIKTDAKIIVAFYTSASADIETHLKDHAQMHLADYKRPKAYVLLDALPQNANGKINRNALRQMKDLIT